MLVQASMYLCLTEFIIIYLKVVDNLMFIVSGSQTDKLSLNWKL